MKLSKKARIIDDGIKSINKKSDYGYLFKKISEIDLLKYLCLTKEQLIIFNYLS
jgi:hypothetical protein